jgi:hypothetical protein
MGYIMTIIEHLSIIREIDTELAIFKHKLNIFTSIGASKHVSDCAFSIGLRLDRRKRHVAAINCFQI